MLHLIPEIEKGELKFLLIDDTLLESDLPAARQLTEKLRLHLERELLQAALSIHDALENYGALGRKEISHLTGLSYRIIRLACRGMGLTPVGRSEIYTLQDSSNASQQNQ